MAVLACAGLLAAGAAALAAPAAPGAATAEARPDGNTAPKHGTPVAAKKPRPLDLSGQRRVGKASFYARHFHGRKMADGQRMDPQDDNAASKTLPLGTRARVTNLETGQQAVVTIQDRGPHVKGRIIDLSPSTARQIGLERKRGLARVEVAPITVPLPNGQVKPGAAAERNHSK
jgi:rare lipoprotein A